MPRNFSIFIEQWRPVSEYQGSYEISNFGRIRGLDRTRRYRHGICKVRGQLLDHHPSNSGYLMVTLSVRPRKVRMVYVHILVAQVFLGERPQGFVVHHIDADKSNNHAYNLAYVSRRQNIELGALVYGESHCNAKLKDQDIPEIRCLAKQGWNSTLIGKMFGVSSGTIWAAINGKTWAHII